MRQPPPPIRPFRSAAIPAAPAAAPRPTAAAPRTAAVAAFASRSVPTPTVTSATPQRPVVKRRPCNCGR